MAMKSSTAWWAKFRRRVDTGTADSTANSFIRDGIGNKTDAAVTTVGTTASIIAYIKGLLNWVGAPVGVSISADIAAVHTHAAGAETQATTAATQSTAANTALQNGGFTDLLIDAIKAKTDLLTFSYGRATGSTDETGYLVPAGRVVTAVFCGTNIDFQVKNNAGAFASYTLSSIIKTTIACDGINMQFISSSGTNTFSYYYWTIG